MPYGKGSARRTSVAGTIDCLLGRFIRMVVVSAASLLLLCAPQFVLADRPAAPRAYTTLSQNGEFEFVMNAPGAVGSDKRQSGLYRRNTTNPLWTVNWYAHSVIISSDGIHLIRRGPWASGLEDEAFSFFKNGMLVREYKIKDLLTTSEGLQFTTSHFFWLKREHFDDAKGVLSVTTLTGDEHSLSIAKGELIHSQSTTMAEKITGFTLQSKTIQLNQPEEIAGLKLPAGTEVKIISAGGRIENAVLHQRVNYRGIDLNSGATLTLMSKRFLDEKNPQRKAYWEEPKDDYADMKVVGVSQPSKWKIGPLSIQGAVNLKEDGDTLTVTCHQDATCLHDKLKVSRADFGDGLRIKFLEKAEDKPFKILVGTDSLEGESGAIFWSNGKLRELTSSKPQRFRGMTVVGELKFWSNGNLQKATFVNPGPNNFDHKIYCKDGAPQKAFEKAGEFGYLNQCDDGSIMYVKRDLLCGQPGLAREKLKFLRERPPGRFKECDDSSSNSIGAIEHEVIFRDIEQ
jgi:hypothetical protein